MNKIKYYAWAITAAVIAALLAVIRHKNNKLADIGAKAEEAKHNLAVDEKAKQYDKASAAYLNARDKYYEWKKNNPSSGSGS